MEYFPVSSSSSPLDSHHAFRAPILLNLSPFVSQILSFKTSYVLYMLLPLLGMPSLLLYVATSNRLSNVSSNLAFAVSHFLHPPKKDLALFLYLLSTSYLIIFL